ncbi:MAG: 16S rRNA (guanine(966)-N(2))-methyltransferase RsmD [Phycisphaerae bacterium]
MRIIGGVWRSRCLVRPSSATTRPVPDRVREAIFDMLGSHYDTPGALPALRVADVFAGSGSMGLEALSRGAGSCCFFERNRAALDALRRNLTALAVGPEARIIARDAWREALESPDACCFDLVLLDPPYADSDDATPDGAVTRYLTNLARLHGANPLVVLHHRARVQYSAPSDEAWSVLRQRTFGSSGVTFFQL